MSFSVSFNGVDLATAVPGLIITSIPTRPPVPNLAVSPIARTDKQVVSSKFYRDKKVNVMGVISASSIPLFRSALDSLNKTLYGKEKTLLLNYGSSTRQWTATLSNTAFTNEVGSMCEFELEFIGKDALGYDTNSTTIVSHSHNVASYKEYFFTLDGSAEWQLPVITITVNSFLSGTSKTITLGNTTTGQKLSVTRTWTAGDVLVVDSTSESVQVNNTDVDFTGAFPKFQLPSGTLSYYDNFSARDTNNVATYQKRWI